MTDDVLAGDSAEQRAAEVVMVEMLAVELGIALANRRLSVSGRTWAEVDGFSPDPPILVEAWAHQGPAKTAQKFKVMTDATKLAWLEAALYPSGERKILLFSDPAAAAHLRGASWMAAALVRLGVEIRIVALPSVHRDAVLRGQKRQFR